MAAVLTESREAWTRRKINEFALLLPPVSAKTIEASLRILDMGTQRGFTRSNAFSGGGEIAVTFYTDKFSLDIRAGEKDAEFTFVAEDDDREIAYEEGLSIEEIEDRLSQFKEKLSRGGA